MICPSCGTNHPRNREGMTCRCGYRFVLDPREGGFTDRRLLRLVDKASANQTYYFTLPQLQLRRRRKVLRQSRSILRWAGFFAVVSLAGFLIRVPILGALMLGLAFITAMIGMSQRKGSLASPEIPAAIARWQSEGREIPKLLTEPSLHEPPPEWREADIYDYGVERVLLVQRDLVVDLLVKNGFHAEERCLVMSETGYPPYLEKVANEILREHAHTPVFLLHDAGVHGERMGRRLRESGRMSIAGHRVVDLGLTEGDLRRLFPHIDPSVVTERHLDYLPYRSLANLVAAAMAAQTPISKLSDDVLRPRDDQSGYG